MLGAQPPPTAAKRILVVEDNELNMKLLNDVLEAHGYEVISTSRGAVAVEWARQYHPDLILMDLQLPDLSGLDATRRIRERPWGRGVAVIALTGWGQDGDRERSREAGCDGHLVKPVDLADLARALTDLADG